MGDDDRSRWDERYTGRGPVAFGSVGPPSAFVDLANRFPASGTALDLACGDGRGAVWLAGRGLAVLAVDASPAAVDLAVDLADRAKVAGRCRVVVADLDEGLLPGPMVDVVLCHLFNAPHLDEAIVARLRPEGLLAVAVLSEVGAPPGRFRARAGELVGRFGGIEELELLDHREGDGVARILLRRSAP